MRSQDERSCLSVQKGPRGCGSQAVIQVAGGVAFGIGEHGGGGGVTVLIMSSEDENGQSLPFEFVPVDREDQAADELLVVLALYGCGLAHERRPT